MKNRMLIVFALVLGLASTAFAAGGHDHGHKADKQATTDHSGHGSRSHGQGGDG